MAARDAGGAARHSKPQQRTCSRCTMASTPSPNRNTSSRVLLKQCCRRAAASASEWPCRAMACSQSLARHASTSVCGSGGGGGSAAAAGAGASGQGQRGGREALRRACLWCRWRRDGDGMWRHVYSPLPELEAEKPDRPPAGLLWERPPRRSGRWWRRGGQPSRRVDVGRALPCVQCVAQCSSSVQSAATP